VLWSAHLSMLFQEVPYLERPRAAANAGFTLVETWWPPDGLAERWADQVARYGLSVASINSYCGDIPAGDRGFLNIAERRDDVIRSFREALALAVRCGAPRINVLVGREVPGSTRDDQLAQAGDVLGECAALADEAGLTILVEPINELDVPGYLVPSTAAAVELIEAAASENVMLLYDAYHAARSGEDPVRDVASVVPQIGHIHYADCPGRGAPGTGDVSLDDFVRSLETARYVGAIGLEFDPKGPTLEALRFLRGAGA
jgi:hydroxypyruvate isomerase